MSRHFKVKK